MHRHKNHDHFWIEGEMLYESYNTLRGLRFRESFEVPNMPDTEIVPDDMLKYIEAEFIQS